MLFPPLGVMTYAIVDVASRRDVEGQTKVAWIVAFGLAIGFAAFVYFIWALMNRPAGSDVTPATPPARLDVGTR